jgi:uncharacterized protein (TIGR00730 family)
MSILPKQPLIDRAESQYLVGPKSRRSELFFAFQIFFQFMKGFRKLHFVGPCVTVFGSARFIEGDPYYKLAREVGAAVAKMGFSVMTGGGPGIMEAASRGSSTAGAKTVGLNIDLPHEQFPNPYISPELCFRFRYFALRKLHLLQRARALVAFPGGFGTLDELFETMTLIQTRTIKPVPVILVGRSFWERAVDFVFLAEAGVIDAEDQDIFWYAESAREAWQGILDWYERCGEPLFRE